LKRRQNEKRFTQNRLGLIWVKRGNWRGGEKTSQELAPGKGSVAVAIERFDHSGGDADGDGVGRDVVINKAKAPTTAFCPIVTPGMMTLRLPTLHFFLKVTLPSSHLPING
jgi:hypothetical protein